MIASAGDSLKWYVNNASMASGCAAGLPPCLLKVLPRAPCLACSPPCLGEGGASPDVNAVGQTDALHSCPANVPDRLSVQSSILQTSTLDTVETAAAHVHYTFLSAFGPGGSGPFVSFCCLFFSSGP